MNVGGQIKVTCGQAYAFIPNPRRYEDADGDAAFTLEGWDPSSAKPYYIDVDDVVTAVRRHEDAEDMICPVRGCELPGSKKYYIDSDDVT